MSNEGNAGFDPLAGRKAPDRLQAKGATGQKGLVKPANDKSRQITFRGTPGLHTEIKRAALDHGLSMEQLLVAAFYEYTGTRPQAQTVTAVQEAPKAEPDPRDRNLGLDRPLALWGDDQVEKALALIAKAENCTPSQLLKALLVARVEDYEKQGRDIGIRTR